MTRFDPDHKSKTYALSVHIGKDPSVDSGISPWLMQAEPIYWYTTWLVLPTDDQISSYHCQFISGVSFFYGRHLAISVHIGCARHKTIYLDTILKRGGVGEREWGSTNQFAIGLHLLHSHFNQLKGFVVDYNESILMTMQIYWFLVDNACIYRTSLMEC